MTESPERAALDLPGSCVVRQSECFRHWFEMDYPAAMAGAAVSRAAEQGPAEGGSRILAVVSGLRESPEATLVCLDGEWEGGDANARAVACVTAIDMLLGAGCHFDRLDAWSGRLAVLLAGGDVSPHARGALLLRRGVLALVRDSDVAAAGGYFAEGEAVAELAASVPLQLAHRALLGVVDCLAGNVTHADVRLSDAEFLCHQDGIGVLPRMLVRSALGLVSLLLGEAERAYATLTAASRMPGVASLPVAMQLPLLGHRMYAAADLGLRDEVQAFAQALGSRVIPAGQALLHAYRHLALGALALRGGQALRALVHAEECAGILTPAGLPLPAMLAVLLKLQALADLRRCAEARDLVAGWGPRWTRLGLHRLAAVARQEQAMLDARSGELDRARKGLAAARDMLPTGELLVPLHRNRAWLDELDALLAPAPVGQAEDKVHVHIRTLGEFVVDINGKRIYDRDWKGVRTKMLLIALICEGGQKVPAERLADMLWPDSDGAQAAQNLKVALHRLRRLGCGEGVEAVNWVHVKHGLVSLPKSLCWVDAHELEALLGAASASRRTDDAIALKARSLYGGDFMPGENNQAWVVAYRRRLQGMLERTASY